VGGVWAGQLCVAMVTDSVFQHTHTHTHTRTRTHTHTHTHRVLKKQLSSKFRHLSFKDSQVKDVTVSSTACPLPLPTPPTYTPFISNPTPHQVHQGSVYLTFTIVAVEGGADPGTVAKTLETEVVSPQPTAVTSTVSVATSCSACTAPSPTAAPFWSTGSRGQQPDPCPTCLHVLPHVCGCWQRHAGCGAHCGASGGGGGGDCCHSCSHHSHFGECLVNQPCGSTMHVL